MVCKDQLTGDTRKIFVSNKTVDESNSAHVLVGCFTEPCVFT